MLELAITAYSCYNWSLHRGDDSTRHARASEIVAATAHDVRACYRCFSDRNLAKEFEELLDLGLTLSVKSAALIIQKRYIWCRWSSWWQLWIQRRVRFSSRGGWLWRYLRGKGKCVSEFGENVAPEVENIGNLEGNGAAEVEGIVGPETGWASKWLIPCKRESTVGIGMEGTFCVGKLWGILVAMEGQEGVWGRVTMEGDTGSVRTGENIIVRIGWDILRRIVEERRKVCGTDNKVRGAEMWKFRWSPTSQGATGRRSARTCWLGPGKASGWVIEAEPVVYASEHNGMALSRSGSSPDTVSEC